MEKEQYFRVLDTQEDQRVVLEDYMGDGTDVQPVADPQLATNLMAMAKNQAMMGVMGHQLVNDEEILRRFFEGLDIPAPELCIIPEEQRQQPPDPELTLKAQIAASEHSKRMIEIINIYADTIKKLAQAESEEKGPQMQLYMKQLEMIQGMVNGQGNPTGMEGAPGNQGSAEPPQVGAAQPNGPNAGPTGTGLPGTGTELPIPQGGV